MYHSFSIKNFRCFDDLTLDGLGRINLIGGKNNIGKSALLEALWIHSGPTDPGRILRLDLARGLPTPDYTAESLFYGFDRGSTIELCAQGSWGAKPRRLSVYAEENPLIQLGIGGPGDDWFSIPVPNPPKRIVLKYSNETGPEVVTKGSWVKDSRNSGNLAIEYDRSKPETSARWSPGIFLLSSGPGLSRQDVERYSRLEIDRQQDGVLQILQVVAPALQRLTVLATSPEPRLYADIGTKPLIPVELMGAGMSRILSLALAIASAPGGLVLVDEIENGLHYTVMEKVWQAIAAFARSYEVQIFATTHSHHCIQSACRAFAADEEELLQLYSLGYRKGKISAARYDRERLIDAFDFGFGVI